MDRDVAPATEHGSLALSRHLLPYVERFPPLVLQRTNMMHLERPVSVAARFALTSAEASDDVVRALRQARTDRDLIYGRSMPGHNIEMLQSPELQDAGFATDHVI